MCSAVGVTLRCKTLLIAARQPIMSDPTICRSRMYAARIACILLCALTLVASLDAKPVSIATATNVASSFASSRALWLARADIHGATPVGRSSDLMLAHEIKSNTPSSTTPKSRTSTLQSVATMLIYVFTYGRAPGFILVAGDDVVEPILGYSFDARYDTGRPSPEFTWWIDQYLEQIRHAIDARIDQRPDIELRWELLAS